MGNRRKKGEKENKKEREMVKYSTVKRDRGWEQKDENKRKERKENYRRE